MRKSIVEEAVKVLQTEPDGMYCSHLMQRMRETCPDLAHESFGFALRTWKQEDASAPTPLLATHDETGFFKLASSSLESYTDEELAGRLGVQTSTLQDWKATGQIPERFVTSDDRYVKSLIDPLIEAYRKTGHASPSEPRTISEDERLQMAILHEEGATVPEIASKFQCDPDTVVEALGQFDLTATETVQPATESPSDPRSRRLTTDERDRILTLHDKGISPKEIAQVIGCTRNAVCYTVQHRETAIDSPPLPSVTVGPFTPSPERPNPVEFQDFVKQYWSVGTRAVDLLFLPPETRTQILHAVREALSFAFEKLNAPELQKPDGENALSTEPATTRSMESPLANSTQRRNTAARRGRPKDSGKYGCRTKAIRVPAHLVESVQEFARTNTKPTDDPGGVTDRRSSK